MEARKDGKPKYYTNKKVKERVDYIMESRQSIVNKYLSNNMTVEEVRIMNEKTRELELKIRDIDYLYYQRIVPHISIPLDLAEKVSQIVDGELKKELDFILKHSDTELE